MASDCGKTARRLPTAALKGRNMSAQGKRVRERRPGFASPIYPQALKGRHNSAFALMLAAKGERV